MRWKILLIGIFAIVIAWFTLVNATTVSVDFLFVTATTSLVFVILISVLLGMSLMAVLWSARAWKMRRLTKGLKQQIAKLQDELSGAHEELADLHSQLAEVAEQEAAQDGESPESNLEATQNSPTTTQSGSDLGTADDSSHRRSPENE